MDEVKEVEKNKSKKMNDKNKDIITCGIIMPISSSDGCSSEHWLEVKTIFQQATGDIETYQFKTMMVSESEDIGIIHKRIVQNVYNSDIVICDISTKNPNVMFELGMRLAFDKPTIIVKDDYTDYSFDTGVIEHLEYPRDLRFTKIVEFKKTLRRKLIATLEESIKNPDYSTFLKSFGQFKIATLDEQEVSPDKAILENISDLRHEIYLLRKNNQKHKSKFNKDYPLEAIVRAKSEIDKCIGEISATSIEDVLNNVDLYQRLIDKISPVRYFPTEEEYREFYDYILKEYSHKKI
ncbi:hypothetical protein [Halonatronum saccharophilum]|uniref:hypothetical protein n=1 Tax=Halonatronum saccharophilum TaxID=150060 RepID=UPI0004AE9FE9|nr:hypothetical protein [Halonatronum saccharophilum]